MRASISAALLLLASLGAAGFVQARKGTTLVVQVLEPDGARMAADVRVLLARSPELVSGSPERPKTLRTLQIAADGSARFERLAPGQYMLRAELSAILYAELDPIAIAAGETSREARLVLPSFGTIAGRLRGCEGVVLDGFAIVVVPEGASITTRMEVRGSPDGKPAWTLPPIAPEGSFKSGPLQPGRSSVSLGYPAIEYRSGSGSRGYDWGALVELGSVDVPSSGELQADFDLAGKLPARIELALKVHGKPGAKSNVCVMSTDEQPRNAAIALDQRGLGRSGAFPPGGVHFAVFGPREEWTWYPKETWTVAGGQTLHLDLDAPIVEGEVQLVDAASGTPLAREEVLVVPDEDVASSHVLTTDKDGRFTLHLEPGRYRIEFGFEKGKDVRSPYDDVVLDWSEASATAQEIAVARKR